MVHYGLPVTQENLDIKVHCSVIDDAVLVSAEITEYISQLFKADIVLQTNKVVNINDLINKQLSIELLEDRFFSGIIKNASIESAETDQEDKVRANNILYISIVPSVFLLTLNRRYRIFQDLSAVEIIDKVLKENSISNIKKNITNAGKIKRVFCVQYGETDWHFISRLLEEEGIHYFFIFTKTEDTIVICDDNTVSAKKIKIDLIPRKYLSYQDYFISDVFNIVHKETLGIKSSSPISFDEDKFLVVSGKANDNASPGNIGEIESYDVQFVQASVGNEIAELMIQRGNCQTKFTTATSHCQYISSGQNLTIKDSIVPFENGDFFVIEVVHSIKQIRRDEDDDNVPIYVNRFKAIPQEVKFKPPLVHEKNRIYGIQTAKVTGPEDSEVYTDKFGRIKLHFHWDSISKDNEKSSAWIRVAHPWAEKGFGCFFIPRVGSEVTVTFINGDPDQPLIIGSAYNGVNIHPENYAEKKFVSTLRSNSSEKSGGFNEFRLDDTKDKEEIFMHAARDMLNIIEHDRFVRLESKDDKKVQHSTFVKKGDHLVTIEEGDMIVILDKGNRSITLKKGDQEISLDKGNLTITVKGDISVKAENIKIEADKNIDISAKGKLTVDTKDDTSFQTAKNFLVNCKMSVTITASMNFKVEAKMNVTVTATININFEAKMKLSEKAMNIAREATLELKDESKLLYKAEGTISEIKSKLSMSLNGGLMLEAKGALIKLN
ncbi:MAG: type VI secretion system tip protein VgrG [Holosporales bacterium]|jgi:type VI secretion system secreted protein VgrG|nr:type VI secretion system tip protein VgrG [Holosporales bacterium]